MEKSAIKSRIDALNAKLERGQRLSAAEVQELRSLGKLTEAYVKRELDAVKSWQNPSQLAVEMRADVSTQIKEAVNRGIIPGISSEPASMIPAPHGYDIFDGKVCGAPGKPGRFGKPGKCGRQATVALRSWRPEVPEEPSIADQKAARTQALAWQMYGAGNGALPWVAGGPSVGHQVGDRQGPPCDTDAFVCTWHSYAANQGVPHPDDVPPVEPKAPAVRATVGTLADLDQTRQFRVCASDPNFCDVTDGVTSVLVRTSEYLAYLRDRGSLPRLGERL